MDFMAAFDAVQIGTPLTVSTGETEPPKDEVHAWALWRSHNFTGTVVEKSPGLLAIQIPADEAGQPCFTITPADSCSFSFPSPDVDMASTVARDKVDEAYEQTLTKQMRRVRRQMLVLKIWDDIQNLKRDDASGYLATLDAPARARHYPNLAAVAVTYGVTLAVAANNLQNRFEGRVNSIAMNIAKLLKAYDDIRAATTPEEKIAIAENLTWEN